MGCVLRSALGTQLLWTEGREAGWAVREGKSNTDPTTVLANLTGSSGSSGPSELHQVGLRCLRLDNPTLISHCTWSALGRAVT